MYGRSPGSRIKMRCLLPGDLPSGFWHALLAYSRGGGCGIWPLFGSPSPHSQFHPQALLRPCGEPYLSCVQAMIGLGQADLRHDSSFSRPAELPNMSGLSQYLVDKSAQLARLCGSSLTHRGVLRQIYLQRNQRRQNFCDFPNSG